MIWRVFFVCLIPFAAFAEPVAIRSGEHGTFSRLVFSITPDADWTVASAADGFVLSLNGETDGYDTSEVFDRIPRDRLLDVQQGPAGELRLVVSCDCHADAFLWRSDRLVVDVIDGSGPSDAIRPGSGERPVERQTPSLNPSPSSVLPDLLALPNGLSLTSGHAPQTPVPLRIVSQSDPLSLSGGVDTTSMETAILEGLARAATQGYLDPRTPLETPATADGDFVPATQPLPIEPPFAGAPSQLGIGISTALDETLNGISDRLSALEAGPCLDNETFDLASWADDRSLHEQIAAMAEDLTGSFGAEPVMAQTNLARLYLHFGFGAEALLVLRSEPTASQTRSVLIELASLIDGYDGPFPQLSSQSGCDTAGGLWAFLAGFGAPETQDRRNQILRNFFAIPQPLRGHLAPRLSERFLQAGLTEEAERALQSTDLPDVRGVHEVQTTRADLANARGEADDALRILRQEVEENPHVSPEAVIDLINLTLDQGQIPSDLELQVAEGLADEHRDQAVYVDLKVAQARGEAARGSFEAALGLLGDLDGPVVVQESAQIYATIADAASPAEFLTFAFEDLPQDLPDETVNRFGQRLITLGFPDRATTLLTRPAVRDAAAERRYLLADAAIKSRDFPRAIEVLLGINTDRANALRAAAYEGLGEYRTALSEGGPEGSSSDALQQFRAQAWDRLSLGDDPVLSDFARARLQDSNSESVTSLTDREALVEQSQNSRRAIETLLEQFREPALTQ